MTRHILIEDRGYRRQGITEGAAWMIVCVGLGMLALGLYVGMVIAG